MQVSLQSTKKLWIPVVLLILIGAGYIRFSDYFTQDDKIEYMVIKTQDYLSTITATGKITSGTVVSIKSEISGTVERIDLDIGDYFSHGEILAFIKNVDLNQNVQQAQIKLKTAENRKRAIEEKERIEAQELLYQAEITLQQQKNTYERIKELYEQGAVSRSEWEQAQYNYELAISKARQAALQAGALESTGSIYKDAVIGEQEARIALEKVSLEQDKARITAPFNGIVLNKSVDVGEFIIQGQELMKIAKDEKLKVIVSVDESYIPKLYIGQSVWIKPEAFQGTLIKGAIDKIAPAVNPEAGTIDVQIQLLDHPEYLKRELTVLVEIVSATYQDAIIIKKSYLSKDENNKVWVLKDGVVGKKEIRILENLGDQVIVGSGLKDGEIVLAPGEYKEGMRLILPEVGE